MGMNVTLRKAGGAVVGTLIRGDNVTTALKLVIPRRDGGVDLTELVWSVQIRAADGKTDVHIPALVHAGERVITFDWLPGGVATSAVGMTEFMVAGMADADDPPVWQSATYYLKIDERVEAEPSDEEAVQLRNLQKLIVYVQTELPDVLAARDEAREAGADARDAAKGARKAGADASAATKNANAAADRVEQALGNIPDDYDELVGRVDDLSKKNAAKLDKQQGAENAGKLLYVDKDGMVTMLALGSGLAIRNGILVVTSAAAVKAICGMVLCGQAMCGEE